MKSEEKEDILQPQTISPQCADRRLVGKLIGPRGSTIRGIQQDSGARINIERGSNLIKISGSDEAMQKAKKMVEDIIDPPTITLTCDPKLIGRVIGPRGSTIRGIQEKSGARINIERGSNIIKISGSDEAMQKAKKMVEDILNPPVGLTMVVLQSRVGLVIGPGGATIKKIERESGAHVKVSTDALSVDPEVPHASLLISGPPEALAKAQELIDMIIHPPFKTILCPREAVAFIIGNGGANIKEVQAESKTQIEIQECCTPGALTIKVAGTDRAIATAIAMLEEDIASAMAFPDYEGPEGSSLRKEAAESAIRREHCFCKASASWTAGDLDQAHAWSVKGKAAGLEMKELNIKARDAIFKFRNKDKGPLYIDLHGLHVQEALGLLKQRLDSLLFNQEDDILQCITGAGHHSKKKVAKIKVAVHQMIVDMNLKYDLKNAGTYIIHA